MSGLLSFLKNSDSDVKKNKSLTQEIDRKTREKNPIFQKKRKNLKKYTSIAKFDLYLKKLNFFCYFGYNFFTLLVFSKSKNTNSIQKFTTGTYRPVISTLRDCQKAHLVLKFPGVATDFYWFFCEEAYFDGKPFVIILASEPWCSDTSKKCF